MLSPLRDLLGIYFGNLGAAGFAAFDSLGEGDEEDGDVVAATVVIGGGD